ncbi:MAG TPA: type VI secretion system membrane subunit TssM [Stellaceae bacterium]|jgi:type VI secretion system protein ImpL|nr:type VI secretion system membrane subunit TssM [Stellaceae bacterium]
MKRIFGTIKGLLFSRFVLYIVGMLVAALLIWFIGPLIGFGDSTPLGGVLQRTLAITLIPAIWGAGASFSNVRYARTNRQLQEDLTQQPAAQAKAAGAEETSELGGRLKEALDLLKKTKVRRTWGSGWLYELPWYIFIGPPGSGKTTALTHSGLNFPLAAQIGQNAVKGVGGTRSCDWWFTDDAVLIDTAGRYTTQDSNAEADAGAWNGFLKLLKKYRKRQPVNGAIVAIGISDLLNASEAQRSEDAKKIRSRLAELYAELGVQFPVYVLFTKADLIAGFIEFFDDLGKDGREQVWGMTFPLGAQPDAGNVVEGYGAEFDGLVGRLSDRLAERLQQEADIQRRATIFGFPQQVAGLKDITASFLAEVFEPNRYQKPARLRGVYFTSGTQLGAPIDRLMGAMAANFGISRRQIAAFSGTGRTYFLTRLLREVIFGEANLVSADAKVEKRARLIHYGVIGGTALVSLLVLTGWIFAYFNNASTIAKIDQQIASYNDLARTVQVDRVADASLQPILPLLAIARDMPGGYAERNQTSPLLEDLGLYQGNKLGSQATAVYRRDLNRLLLPRMLVRLEQQLAQNQSRPDFLYEALKVYLMLGAQGKLDKSLVKRWMTLDWTLIFPGPENDANRNALAGHLDALLERPLTPIPLDANLVEKTRAILQRLPIAERVYSLIKTHPTITALPEWRIADHAGPAAARGLVLRSGKPLSEGVAGLYTHDGYYFAFKPLLPQAATEIARETWVLGLETKVADDPASIARLKNDVTSLYLEDFAAQWDRLLSDISIPPFAGPAQAAQILNVLSAPDSPLRTVLINAANETWLSHVPEQPLITSASPNALSAAAAAAAQQAATQAAQQAASRASQRTPQIAGGAGGSLAEQQLASVVGTQGVANTDPAGPFTDQRFKALHELVAGDGHSAPPIDGAIADLNDMYTAVNRAGPTGDTAHALVDAGGMQKIQADAARQPDPLKSVMTQAIGQVASLNAGDMRSQLNALWTSQVVPFCTSALDNRYPAFKSATNEITLDDFARLFGKGGLIDTFFTTNLRQYVDISKNPWVWQRVNNVDLGIPPATLAQFQRAITLRDNMFAGGGGKPGVSFDIVPVDLDAKSTQVVVEIDGQTITYDHGPPRAVHMVWPGPSGVGHVRIAFQPQTAGASSAIEKDGVWAWFRVLQGAGLKQSTGADRYLATFKVDDRVATFEIRANSVINPFASSQLDLFRCPPRL